MWQYRRHLPVQKSENIVSLGEGNTPVFEIHRNVFLKLEQLNPTGSYKDRFASCSVSWMKETGKTRCLATSSRNTGAALAGYCARAGFSCEVFLVESVPKAKMLQVRAYGAMLKQVPGFGACASVTEKLMEDLRRQAQHSEAALFISAFAYSPTGMEGVKTIAYELSDDLKRIDDIFIPVGGGGLLTAVYRGFGDFGRSEGKPRLHAVQPEGCATVAGPLCRGEAQACPVECKSSISGLQVPNVIDGQMALNAVRESLGTGQISSAARVVCLVTGHGFKDLDAISRLSGG